MQKILRVALVLSLVLWGAACSSGAEDITVRGDEPTTTPAAAPEVPATIDEQPQAAETDETQASAEPVVEEAAVADADGDDVPPAPVEAHNNPDESPSISLSQPLQFKITLNQSAHAPSCLPIHFEDENLKAAVARTLGTNKVTRCNCDMEKINHGYYVDVESSLEGLQYCTNLRELNIGQVDISNSEGTVRELDLRPLQHLSKLTSLELDANISSLAPLSGLAELRKLNVWNLGDSLSINHHQLDIGPLQHLSKLTSFRMFANIPSLVPLSRLEELKELQIRYDLLTDRASLSGLTRLQKLRLSLEENAIIHDLEPLRGMHLLELSVIGKDQSPCTIHDMSALSSLSDLRVLKVESCRFSHLDPLQGLTNLEWLDLYNNNISDLTPLRGLTNLKWLDLYYNNISDLTPLQDLINLEHLDLQFNQLTDLGPLYDLLMRAERLTQLWLEEWNERNLFPGNDLRRAQMNAHYLRQINAELATRNSAD